MLMSDEYAVWLAPDTPEREKALLRPYRIGELVTAAVGSKVGNAWYAGPECSAPAARRPPDRAAGVGSSQSPPAGCAVQMTERCRSGA